jgi:hypothetical protein
VQLVFKITQHVRDIALLNEIKKLMDCGRVETRKTGDGCDFVITSINEHTRNLIPFLERNPLKGSKNLNYKDWRVLKYLI